MLAVAGYTSTEIRQARRDVLWIIHDAVESLIVFLGHWLMVPSIGVALIAVFGALALVNRLHPYMRRAGSITITVGNLLTFSLAEMEDRIQPGDPSLVTIQPRSR